MHINKDTSVFDINYVRTIAPMDCTQAGTHARVTELEEIPWHVYGGKKKQRSDLLSQSAYLYGENVNTHTRS